MRARELPRVRQPRDNVRRLAAIDGTIVSLRPSHDAGRLRLRLGLELELLLLRLELLPLLLLLLLELRVVLLQLLPLFLLLFPQH